MFLFKYLCSLKWSYLTFLLLNVYVGMCKKHKGGDISQSHIVVVMAQQTIWRLVYQFNSYKHGGYQGYLVNT